MVRIRRSGLKGVSPVVDVPGVGHQGGGDGLFQEPADLQEALEGKGAGGHDIEGVGSPGLGLPRPRQDLRFTEGDAFGEDAGSAGQGAEAAVEGAGLHIDADVEMVFAFAAELGPGHPVGGLDQGVGHPAVKIETQQPQRLFPVDAAEIGAFFQDIRNMGCDFPAHNSP